MVSVFSSIFYVPGYYLYVKLWQSDKVPLKLANHAWASDHLSLLSCVGMVCLVGGRDFIVQLRLGRRANLCP